jgi:hypothetical protein
MTSLEDRGGGPGGFGPPSAFDRPGKKLGESVLAPSPRRGGSIHPGSDEPIGCPKGGQAIRGDVGRTCGTGGLVIRQPLSQNPEVAQVTFDRPRGMVA